MAEVEVRIRHLAGRRRSDQLFSGECVYWMFVWAVAGRWESAPAERPIASWLWAPSQWERM